MNNDSPYNCYHTFLKETYGKPVNRIPINLTFSCPNRNEDGSGGCAFCGESGAMAVHLNSKMTLAQQVSQGIQYSKKRYGHDIELMAYFQAYTSTNAPIEEVKKAFETVLALGPFKFITISTRPDCLPNEVLDYFTELTDTHEVWVELGIQTAHDRTLETINRGHTYAQSVEAVYKLQSRGLKVAAHIILGLPGETQADYRETAERLSKLPLSGLKIHNLHVVKNTSFAALFRSDKITVLDEHEYGEVLIDFLRHIPAHLPIMRMTSDTPASLLIAPRWWMKKPQFIQYIRKQMTQRKVCQGDLIGQKVVPEIIPSSYQSIPTDDGSLTFYSPQYKENFHCHAGALSEAQQKFIEPARLAHRLKSGPVRILDIGFGLGTNALSAFELADDTQQLEIVSLEKDRQVVIDSAKAYPQWGHIYQALIETSFYQEGEKRIEIIWGDARNNLKKLVEKRNHSEAHFDLIFHDAFSTQKNPELWTLSFFRKETSLLKQNGVLLTYSNALPIRGALQRCGLQVGETKPYGRTRGGTIAGKNLDSPLPLSELEAKRLVLTTAGVPYIDPRGTWTRKRILNHRQKVVTKLHKLGVKKRI